MASQLGYCYATNRRAARPFSRLTFSSFSAARSPRLFPQLKKANCDSWMRCDWREQDVDRILETDQDTRLADHSDVGSNGVVPDADASALEGATTGVKSSTGLDKGKGKQLVYLSADSEHELQDLSENESYIIGGLVDRNRHKVRTAKKTRAELIGCRCCVRTRPRNSGSVPHDSP